MKYLCVIPICLVNFMMLYVIKLNPRCLYWIASILSSHWDFGSIYDEGVIPLFEVRNYLTSGH